MNATGLTPRQIVSELDRYIVGQAAAKRAVAIALRNRQRRKALPEALRDEVMPKNILMIGPTGVGKTEIARRLAKLTGAPFIKVEATKFTEVGYVGRDVDGMVRDLVETAIRLVKSEKLAEVEPKAQAVIEDRLLDLLAPIPRREPVPRNPLEFLFGGPSPEPASDSQFDERVSQARAYRAEVARRLAAGDMEAEVVEVEVSDQSPQYLEFLSGQGSTEVGVNLGDLFGNLLPKRSRKRRVSVAEARKLLLNEEAQKLLDLDQVHAEAVHRAEQSGIIFIDEMDKIAGRESGRGPDVSREGVQRDILPIVEGTTVQTRYGPVRTDHVLFIAAGAFHVSKPSDLIPELQGRFPIRVELEPLSAADFTRILTEPENSLTRQYAALLASEGVELVWEPTGVTAIAELAGRLNEQSENIGARRLHTMLERLLEDVSFDAPEIAPTRVVIDRVYVERKLGGLVADRDLSRYIL